MQICVINIKTFSINSILDAHRNSIVSLLFGEGSFSNCLFSASDDCTFLIWDLSSRSLLYTSQIFACPLTLLTLNNSTEDICRVNIGFSNGDVKIYDFSLQTKQVSVRLVGSLNARDYLHVNNDDEKSVDLVITNKRNVDLADANDLNPELSEVSVSILSIDYVSSEQHNVYFFNFFNFYQCIVVVTPCCLIYVNSSSLQVLDLIYTLGHGKGHLNRNKEFERIGLISMKYMFLNSVIKVIQALHYLIIWRLSSFHVLAHQFIYFDMRTKCICETFKL